MKFEIQTLASGIGEAARTNCSAELHSAVSQISNLRRAKNWEPLRRLERPADCKSAVQQVKNLRYGRRSAQ